MNRYFATLMALLLASSILPVQAAIKVLATTPEWASLTRELGGDKVDVYAATIPDLPFAPALHVHYGETVLPIKDGLPKHKDLPAEFGGSGEILAE